MTGLYADAHLELTREAAHKIYLFPDSHQEALLTAMLNGRHEMATLCGFPSYAHRSAKCTFQSLVNMVNPHYMDLMLLNAKGLYTYQLVHPQHSSYLFFCQTGIFYLCFIHWLVISPRAPALSLSTTLTCPDFFFTSPLHDCISSIVIFSPLPGFQGQHVDLNSF